MNARYYIPFILFSICSSCSLNGQESNGTISILAKGEKNGGYNFERIYSPKDSLYAELSEKYIKYPISDSCHTLTIYNNTNLILYTVNFNTIERYVKGEWKTPNLKEGKNDITFAVEGTAIFVNPHESKKVWLNFHTDRYEYATGKFRIKKPIWLENSTETQFIYSEFEIIE